MALCKPVLFSSFYKRSSLLLHIGTFKTRSTKAVQNLLPSLSAIVGNQHVSVGESVLNTHGQDCSFHPGKSPDVVVFPQNTMEISEICKMCSAQKVPIIPYGTGTGLEGGISAIHGGVCIDMHRMDMVVDYNPEDFDITVQPAITRKMLNQHVRHDGLWLPVDPGADASVCGMCATSASGTNAVRYGTVKENCLNMEVVCADGTVMYTGGIGKRSRKTSAGYNMTELFIGSEGTLGIITGATMRLHAKCEAEAAAVVPFPTVQAAIASVVETLQCSIPVARIEFLDELAIRACNNYSKTTYAENPTLFLEFHGTKLEVDGQVDTFLSIASHHGGNNFEWATLEEDRQRLWKARHDMHWSLPAMRPGSCNMGTDVCVPISMLPKMLDFSKQLLDYLGLSAPVFGHVGDGNFHVNIYYEPNNKDSFEVCKQAAEQIGLEALKVGGTCTGEHGIGIGKVGLLAKQYGPDGMKIMRSLKHALDPFNILNPGKVLK